MPRQNSFLRIFKADVNPLRTFRGYCGTCDLMEAAAVENTCDMLALSNTLHQTPGIKCYPLTSAPLNEQWVIACDRKVGMASRETDQALLYWTPLLHINYPGASIDAQEHVT